MSELWPAVAAGCAAAALLVDSVGTMRASTQSGIDAGARAFPPPSPNATATPDGVAVATTVCSPDERLQKGFFAAATAAAASGAGSPPGVHGKDASPEFPFVTYVHRHPFATAKWSDNQILHDNVMSNARDHAPLLVHFWNTAWQFVRPK